MPADQSDDFSGTGTNSPASRCPTSLNSHHAACIRARCFASTARLMQRVRVNSASPGSMRARMGSRSAVIAAATPVRRDLPQCSPGGNHGADPEHMGELGGLPMSLTPPLHRIGSLPSFLKKVHTVVINLS